jgi:pimeloyl-ACP methyl ester carboxylesterase
MTDASMPPLNATPSSPLAITPRRRRWLRGLLIVALLLVALYAGAIGWLWSRQEAMIFRPEPLAADVVLATEPDVVERYLDVPGARLNLLELRLPRPRGVVFFLHGNSRNLQTWFVNTALYRQAGYDLVMMDYRGYGKSSGHIDGEAELMADVRAVWADVAPRYAGLTRVVYGRSLGSGLAAQLAVDVQPELTVLVSPYRSMLALALDRYPFVPDAALRYPLRSDLALPQVRTPVLLVHGTADTLIPPSHSAALQALAPQARTVLIDGAGHSDIHQHPAYLALLQQALAEPQQALAVAAP